MLAEVNNELSARDQLSLRRNIFEKLSSDVILKQEIQRQEMTAKDKIEHLKNERERLSKTQPKPSSSSPQSPASAPSDTPTTSKPSHTSPRQRLPEAIEAERRRGAKSDS